LWISPILAIVIAFLLIFQTVSFSSPDLAQGQDLKNSQPLNFTANNTNLANNNNLTFSLANDTGNTTIVGGNNLTIGKGPTFTDNVNVSELPSLEPYTGPPIAMPEPELEEIEKAKERANFRQLNSTAPFVQLNSTASLVEPPSNNNTVLSNNTIKTSSSFEIPSRFGSLIYTSPSLTDICITNPDACSGIPGEQPIVTPEIRPQSGFEGLSFTGYAFPPDVQMAAGHNHIVEMVNVEGAIYEKEDTLRRSFDLRNFFIEPSGVPASHLLFDPVLIYDTLSDRWFAAISDATNSSIRVAVSTTADPTGTWYRHNFDFGRPGMGDCPDRSQIAANNDKVIITANDYSGGIYCRGSLTFLGEEHVIIDKNDLISGSVSPAYDRSTRPDNTTVLIKPVRTSSSLSPLYALSSWWGDRDSVTLTTFTGPVHSIIRSDVAIPVSFIAVPPNAEQPSTSNLLETGSGNVMDAIESNGNILMVLTNACEPPGDVYEVMTILYAINRSCIRLIEINPADTSRSVQDINIGDRGSYFFYPAISSTNGFLVISYGHSSATTYPSFEVFGATEGTLVPGDIITHAYSVRVGSAPVDLYEQPLLPDGITPDPDISHWRWRWGDYFALSVDPADPTVVWIAGEYQQAPTAVESQQASARGWSTYISKIQTYRPTP
jgi:hypothetical protein